MTMTNKAVRKPDIPYPDMIHQVGERIAKRIREEFIREQSILFHKEEAAKREAAKKESGVRIQETEIRN
jgi:hypothetical protein